MSAESGFRRLRLKDGSRSRETSFAMMFTHSLLINRIRSLVTEDLMSTTLLESISIAVICRPFLRH